MKQLQGCKQCSERQFGAPLVGEGLLQSEFCILGRNGGVYEGKRKRPWVGPAGKKMRQGLSLAKILIWQCYFTNVVKCPTPPGIGPTKQCYINCTKAWLGKELEQLRSVKVIICFGRQALYYFCPDEKLESVHGHLIRTIRPWAPDKCIAIFATVHPTQALREESLNILFESDMLNLAAQIRKSV